VWRRSAEGLLYCQRVFPAVAVAEEGAEGRWHFDVATASNDAWWDSMPPAAAAADADDADDARTYLHELVVQLDQC